MEQVKRINPAMPAALLMAGIYVLIIQYALQQYINWRSPGFILGLVAIPVVMIANPQQKRSLRFYYAALACCLLAWLLPVKTMLYACLVLGFCFLADNVFGKINTLPLLAMGLMGPLFDYITRIFTFPIRLQLTQWAAGLLQALGMPAIAEGNAILFNGAEFSVDAACMGLGMMVTAMLCGLMLLGVYQKNYGKALPFLHVCLLLGLVLLLNITANLFRILVLVILHILPGNPLHDAMGLLTLAVYVLLPLVWLCPLIVKKFGKPIEVKPAKVESDRFMLVLSHLCLAACIFLVAYKTNFPATTEPATTGLPSMPGYTTEALAQQVYKVENEQALVYLKTTGGFYRTDHNPTICWLGSGFEFKQVKEEAVAGKTVYTAMLQKGEEQLFTAWWYTSGAVQTISQWQWRWDALRNGNTYTLVNVTAENPATLRQEVQKWLAWK